MSGIRTELAAVQSHIGKIEKTTNVDRWTFFGAVVVVPLVLSYLFMRATRRYATCEAKKHGYLVQREARLHKGRVMPRVEVVPCGEPTKP